MEAMVKIGDSISDVQEGLNAGMWTIGLTKSGNEMGLTLDEISALPKEEVERRIADNAARFKAAGAHYTAESIAECPAIIRKINERLADGETPAP
ncbi:MAG: phosphonoacetaldehyde hydrolase, partial [Pseudodesulfovibrio sp.]|nr:phosphonoacetaldehyde hydrolase [Pseudodesulfovibrio sp.]